MKKIILAFMLMGMLYPNLAKAQTKAINTFYKKNKKIEGANSASIPGVAIDIAASIVKFSAETEQDKQAVKLLRKVNKLKFLNVENNSADLLEDLKQLKSALKKDSFDEMLSVRSEGTRLEFMVRPRNGKLKNIFLTIIEDGEVNMVSLKTRIKLKDIQKLINSLQSEYEMELGIPKEIKEDENDDELLKA